MHLKEIEPIQSSPAYPETVGDLDKFVERPLLAACRQLYQKGIQTVGSSANRENLGTGSVWIVIDASTMSEANLAIARRLGKMSNGHYYNSGLTLTVSLPVHDEITVEEVEAWSLAQAAFFAPQPARWIKRFSLEEIRAIHFSPEMQKEDAIKSGFFFDETSARFFFSEEQCAMWSWQGISN